MCFGATSAEPEGWIVVPLTLRLRSPLAVTGRTLGNVVETLDFLPGTYLLPHISKILRSLKVDPYPLFAAGDVAVLPGTRELARRRSLPVPLAFFSRKGEDHTDPATWTNRMLGDTPPGQYKQLRQGYVAVDASNRWVAYASVPTVQRTHNSVDDMSQRPTPEVGGVYTYEAISPVTDGRPTCLRTELRLRKSVAERLKKADSNWWKKLAQTVALGRSKKDDYGEVEVVPSEPCEYALEQDLTNPAAIEADDCREWIVWVLSDVLLRNEYLAPSPCSETLAHELGRRLNVQLSVAQSDDRLNEFVRVRRVESWHTGWGLPRPTLMGIQAGSCIRLRVEGRVDLQRLQEVCAGGIGERTGEGYGRLAVQPVLLTEPLNRWATFEALATQEANQEASQTSLISKDDEDDAWIYEYARLLEREAWKKVILQAVQDFAGSDRRKKDLRWDPHDGENGKPPMSQLGTLRNRIAALRASAQPEINLDWLESLKEKRADRWPDKGQSLEVIHQLLSNSDRNDMWSMLGLQTLPVLTQDGKSELKRELRTWTLQAFFDACIRAHKREKEQTL
ncbi:MAG: hypothetical protein D6741_03735 [Planctomycetota bacterium]|nr:MAG: hypothetical protein D6741_03735 [Planctomycetota bacterium]